MPRQPNGDYNLPLPNVVSGEVVESSWANTTLSDIAVALTDSLSRTGQGGLSAPLLVPDGTKAAPGLAFINEAGTGMHRPSAGDLYFATLGKNYLRLSDDSGVQFTLNDGVAWQNIAGYSQGEWTPNIVGFNMDLANGGLWTRIGNQVTVFGDVRWTTMTGAPTDEVVISGLPWSILTPTEGNARMFPTAFMAWSNVNLSGRGFDGDIEVFTRAIVRDEDEPTHKSIKPAIYIGANDVSVTPLPVTGGNAQAAEPLTSAAPGPFANQVVYPTLQELLPNGEFSFSLTYLTDDPHA